MARRNKKKEGAMKLVLVVWIILLIVARITSRTKRDIELPVRQRDDIIHPAEYRLR